MLGDADELAVVTCNGLNQQGPQLSWRGATVVARIGVQLGNILGQRQGRLVQARVGKSQNLA